MKPTSVAALIAFLLLTVTEASALTCTDEKPSDLRLSSVEKDGRVFNIFASYCPKEVTVGRTVTVTVRIETEVIPGAPLLEIKDVPSLVGEDAGRITFSATDPVPDNKLALSVREYNYPVKISESAEPRKYMVHLNFGFPDNHPDKKREHQEFALPVGVNSKGKLEIAKESQYGSFQAAMFSPVKHKYKLKVRNFFRDYTTYVTSINVDSIPSGWISPITLVPAKDEVWSIAPTGEKTFTFDLDTAPLNGNLVRGFGGTPPQLSLTSSITMAIRANLPMTKDNSQ